MYSHKFNDNERNWTVAEMEPYAILFAFKHFQRFLRNGKLLNVFSELSIMDALVTRRSKVDKDREVYRSIEYAPLLSGDLIVQHTKDLLPQYGFLGCLVDGDHRNLARFAINTMLTGRLARWYEEMQEAFVNYKYSFPT